MHDALAIGPHSTETPPASGFGGSSSWQLNFWITAPECRA